jgi:hypothetical protein
LAAQITNAHFIEIPGGHNDWAFERQVKLTP